VRWMNWKGHRTPDPVRAGGAGGTQRTPPVLLQLTVRAPVALHRRPRTDPVTKPEATKSLCVQAIRLRGPKTRQGVQTPLRAGGGSALRCTPG
jgi:hypothetical protein